MSARRSSEELIAGLAERLEPVRPVAPLHRQMLVVAAIWALSAAVVALWLGMHPLGVVERGAVSALLLAVLALIGLGGLTLGLAARIPGRERLALAAAAAAAAGLAAVVALGLALPGSAADAGPRAEWWVCFERSLLLAIPSGVLAVALALRAAPWRERATGLGLGLGAVSLGALLVHLSCPSPSPWHWLLAHALLPLACGVPLGLLAGWLMRRLGSSRHSVV